jgi:hypothetical protein
MQPRRYCGVDGTGTGVMARRARKAMFMVLLRGGIGIRVTRPRGRWYRF